MRRFIPQTLCALLVATVLTGFFFNRFALEVSNFNDEVRSWVAETGGNVRSSRQREFPTVRRRGTRNGSSRHSMLCTTA